MRTWHHVSLDLEVHTRVRPNRMDVDPATLDRLEEKAYMAVREGHDPQLEKAVALLLDELAKHPLPVYHKPPYPNYHQGAGGGKTSAQKETP